MTSITPHPLLDQLVSGIYVRKYNVYSEMSHESMKRLCIRSYTREREVYLFINKEVLSLKNSSSARHVTRK